MPSSETVRQISPREHKRRKILRAAIDVFSRDGYYSARMTDVAREAGVADGTLYLYFEGKEHLLLSVFDDVLDRFVLKLREEISAIEDPIRKVSIMIELHLEALGRDRALAQVLQVETRHSRHFMSILSRGKLGEYLSLLKGIIEEGQDLGVFRKDIRSSIATNVIFGAVDELVNRWLLSEDPGDLLRLHAPLQKMLLEGLVPCRHHQKTARNTRETPHD